MFFKALLQTGSFLLLLTASLTLTTPAAAAISLPLPLFVLQDPVPPQDDAPPQVDCDELAEQIAAAEEAKQNAQVAFDAAQSALEQADLELAAAAHVRNFWREAVVELTTAQEIACASGSVILCDQATARLAAASAKLSEAETAYLDALTNHFFKLMDSVQAEYALGQACTALDELTALQEEHCD